MFGNLSLLVLQEYWWVIISILGAALVFQMFVQGGQTLVPMLGKNSVEKKILYNSVGRRWDITFTTIVTYGGAFFASFPLFYSTSFGGAYWVWMIILFSFIIQAVSYEFRTKANNFLGEKTYNTFLFINGLLAPLLIGVAVGTFFTGSEFSIDFSRLTNEEGSNVISQWEGTAHGLEAAFNITNLLLGLAVLTLSRVLGNLYFIATIDNEKIITRARKALLRCSIAFLVLFLSFLALLLTKEGFAVNPVSKEVFMENYKYLHNFLEMPVVLGIFLVGVVLVLLGIYKGVFTKSTKGIWHGGLGSFFAVFALLLIAGFNNTAFYPSTFNLQDSLTIENASSSHYTLVVMSYVSLFIPVVIAYIWYAWKSLVKKKIDKGDVQNDDMAY
jgi:cytochrome bd ubiquinol oxidase subunit II